MKLKIKNSNIIFLVILLLSALHLSAQNQERYSSEHFVSGKDTLNYRMLVPKDFDISQKYPIELFLHGAGERGNDNVKQLIHGGELFIQKSDSFPAIVIFPQCPETDYWANVEVGRNAMPLLLTFPKDSAPTTALTMVMGLMDNLISHPYVNNTKVYVGGLSMGGMGTFEILFRKPELFAAAFSICGAGNPESTEAYAKTVPMWIFHGAKDDVVNPQQSLDMVTGISKYGGFPNLSVYAKDNHNSWDSAFAEPKLISWLFSNSKSNSQ